MRGRKPFLTPSAGIPPDPPQHLQGEARAAWDRLVPDLLAGGVLHRLDLGHLAGYCAAWQTFLDADRQLQGADLVIVGKQGCVANPLLSIRERALNTMHKLGAELGLSPISRQRLRAKDEEGNGVVAFEEAVNDRLRGAS